MSKSKFNLVQYAYMAVCVLSGKWLSAQVVYTNLEPDVVLDQDDESCFLDLNVDLNNDVHFLNVSNYFEGYWTSGSINYIFPMAEQRIKIIALGNSIAGSLVTYSTYSSGTIHRIFPYALEDNLINSSLQFQNAYNQTLNFKNVYYIFGTYSSNGGNWFPEIIDHYIGIHFKDSDEITHFGWIRCDVKDEGRTLVIKDYAYETEPDYPIVAGDTTHYVDINNIQNSIDASVYSFGRDIYILTETFHNTEVVIYDLNGRQIIGEVLQNKSISISMKNYPAGIYLVTLLKEGKRYDKKVIIE